MQNPHETTRHDMTQHDMTQHDMTQHDMTQPIDVRFDLEKQNK